jgi:SNF2 family DNA or RNA helicase
MCLAPSCSATWDTHVHQLNSLLHFSAVLNCLQVEQQPPYVFGTELQRHQLAALQWLRSMWVAKRPAVLADEQGLGKTASCIAYIASLLAEFKATAPVLVVVPLSMLGFWEGMACWVW